jgi:hypothetical protein
VLTVDRTQDPNFIISRMSCFFHLNFVEKSQFYRQNGRVSDESHLDRNRNRIPGNESPAIDNDYDNKGDEADHIGLPNNFVDY